MVQHATDHSRRLLSRARWRSVAARNCWSRHGLRIAADVEVSPTPRLLAIAARGYSRA